MTFDACILNKMRIDGEAGGRELDVKAVPEHRDSPEVQHATREVIDNYFSTETKPLAFFLGTDESKEKGVARSFGAVPYKPVNLTCNGREAAPEVYTLFVIKRDAWRQQRAATTAA